MSESCVACNACCRRHLIYATERDVQREPRIALRAVQDEPGKYRLCPGLAGLRCPFLTGWGGCEIYQTRPDGCRNFPRGGEGCARQRQADGKAPLTLLDLAEDQKTPP